MDFYRTSGGKVDSYREHPDKTYTECTWHNIAGPVELSPVGHGGMLIDTAAGY